MGKKTKAWSLDERNLNFLILILFFVTSNYSCSQSKKTISPSVLIPEMIFQGRTPMKLLEIVAEHNLRKLEPGEYRMSDNWEDLVNSKKAIAEWFGYPMGVTLMGLQRANTLLMDSGISEYVTNYNITATKTYSYQLWQKEKFGKTVDKGGAFDRICRMSMLDDCGAAGAEMLESVLTNKAEMTDDMLRYLSDVARFISYDVDRLPDSSFWRPLSPGSRAQSLWADDLYMSCPFLIRWAEYTKDQRFLDDAVRQIINYASYLQDADGIWWHAYLVDENRPAKFKWGRANGWVMMATAEVLSAMPENHPRYNEVLTIFRKHIEGLKQYQSESGLWAQIIDRPDLKWGDETSSSAMFTYSISRAINKGWIAKTNLQIVEKAIMGLSSKIEANGSILGVCQSASIGDNLEYYENRPTRPDDQHGPGSVLLALSEYIAAEKNQNSDVLNK